MPADTLTTRQSLVHDGNSSLGDVPTPNRLSRRAPDTLEEAILLCEPVQRVIGLAHGANEAAKRVGLVPSALALSYRM